MPVVTLLWSGILFLLQRGTVGVIIFLLIWVASVILTVDGVAVVTYQKSPSSGLEEQYIRLDAAAAGIQFTVGLVALIVFSGLTFFVDFYEEHDANTGLRALFGSLPLLLMALIAYFMLQR